MDTVTTPQPASREAVAISLFGPLAIREGNRSLGDRDLGGARPKQVLEILLAARGHRVPTDRLADLRWGERLPQNAAAALQTFISVLRRRLSADRRGGRDSSWSPGPMRIGSPVSWPTSTSTSTPSISCSSVQERPRRARRGACSGRLWHSCAAGVLAERAHRSAMLALYAHDRAHGALDAHASRQRAAMRRPITVPLLETGSHDRGNIVARIDVRDLMAAIAAAPEPYRDAVVAVDVVGLSYRQAARQLRTREATITSRLSRGRQHIARALGEPASASKSAG
jgi:hypothetical protein